MTPGSPISSCFHNHTVEATFPCEAEYISLSVTLKEDLWLTQRLWGLTSEFKLGLVFSSHRRSAFKLAGSKGVNHRNKHIDIANRSVHDAVARKGTAPQYMQTNDIISDIFM